MDSRRKQRRLPTGWRIWAYLDDAAYAADVAEPYTRKATARKDSG